MAWRGRAWPGVARRGAARQGMETITGKESDVASIEPWLMAVIGFGVGMAVTVLAGWAYWEKEILEVKKLLALQKKSLEILESLNRELEKNGEDSEMKPKDFS